MNRYKLTIPILFILLFSIISFSGCLLLKEPVKTRGAWCEYELGRSFADAFYSHYCKIKNPHFVYDTESRENWEEYRFTEECDLIDPTTGYFRCEFMNLTSRVIYYTRAVVFCYDFWGPLKDYENGCYQGEEFYFEHIV